MGAAGRWRGRKAHTFGGGHAGTTGQGWDEDYTLQMERWLAQANLPEPFCLIFSLVNPHDVLGYPSSFEDGGYSPGEFDDLGVPLPRTLDENLREKPTVQALMKLGQTSYLGALKGRRQQQRYVNFYAHLHRLVDAKIGRLLAALGDPGDPGSLRSRTVIVRTSDHGEMGLSHGGLRQKMFNAYEESLRVPFVVSSPALFPEPRESDALGLAGGRGAHDARPRRATPGRPGALRRSRPRPGAARRGDAVRDAVLFTYDDHQAGTAFQDAPGQPNRIRCVRDTKLEVRGLSRPEREGRAGVRALRPDADPDEALNLVDKRTGRGRTELARARSSACIRCWNARVRQRHADARAAADAAPELRPAERQQASSVAPRALTPPRRQP